jgi:DNA-binding MarR family transcriptional regulator
MQHRNLIGHEIKTLSNLIKRRIDQSEVFAEASKLTGTHGRVIGFLYDNQDRGELFQRDIEIEFSIRRSTATGILQLMEKNDMIRRESVSYDARLKKLVLTPKAIAVHETIVNEILKIEEQLSKGLTEEEKNLFFTMLGKMKANME